MLRRLSLSRERLEYYSLLAEIVAAFAVVVSLVFVGLQVRGNTVVALRDEANVTQEQWSNVRRSIYADENTARMFWTGLETPASLTPVERLRFGYAVRELGWATYHIWDRAQTGLLPQANFRAAAGDFFQIICTPGGAPVWATAKVEYPPSYVADLDRLSDDCSG